MNTDRIAPWDAEPALRARIQTALGRAFEMNRHLSHSLKRASKAVRRLSRFLRGPSRGQRKHIRRQKAAARRAA